MHPVCHVFQVIYRKARKLVSFLKLHTLQAKVGRPLSLSITDALAYGLYWKKGNIKTKKALWELVEPTCSYKTFVASLNRWSVVAAFILMALLKTNRARQHPVKHIDSTAIPVCKYKNRKHHKTMRLLAAVGHTGDGPFYGIKLHLISDLLGYLQSLTFASGNVPDRDPGTVAKLTKDIWGLLIGDAGYVSQKLTKLFNRTDRLLMVKPYKNMKKIATKLQGLLYGTRMLIERHFRCLKEFYGLVTSITRSVNGYLANYLYSILAYQLV
jgi:hypothetical protein